MAQIDAAAADRPAHRLDRENAVHVAVEQKLERQVGVILAVAMGVAQQAIEIAVSSLVLRHQHQRIL